MILPLDVATACGVESMSCGDITSTERVALRPVAKNGVADGSLPNSKAEQLLTHLYTQEDLYSLVHTGSWLTPY